MWTWIATFASASLGFANGAAIASGAIGSAVAGSVADRIGKARIAVWAMLASGACCATAGFVFHAPAIVLLKADPTLSLARAPMGLFLDRRHHLHERAQVVARDTPADRLFELHQLSMDPARDLPALGGGRDDERAPVGRPHRARDEAPRGEPIENARERRALVGEPGVQLRDGGRRRGGEQGEDVRLALRQPLLRPAGQVETDPVRRSVNGRNQS